MAQPTLVITADTFEKPSGIPALLEELGASVTVQRLASGDYDVGGSTLVERKSVLDFHSSLVTQRLWRQLGVLRKAARYPFLLVEGYDLDNGPIAPAAVRGACIASMRLGIRLLQSRDPADSALWLFRLAVLCQRPTGGRVGVSGA